MTNSNEALRACPFCNVDLEYCSDKDGEFWMHPGLVTDGECFMSGTGIFPRQVAAWNRRPSPVAGGDLREDGWFDMADAPIGELIVAQANTGAGGDFWMNPYVVRNEGRLYSKWQYNNGKEWVNWPDECPLARWRPIFPSLNQPAAPVEAVEDILPCDVRLPPATTIRAGCSFDTLRLALTMPDRPRHFSPPEPAASTVAQGEAK